MVSRTAAATVGAYGAGSLVAFGLGRAWPGSAVEGATAAMLAAPLAIAALAVWSFAAARPSGAWLVMAGAVVAGGAAALLST